MERLELHAYLSPVERRGLPASAEAADLLVLQVMPASCVTGGAGFLGWEPEIEQRDGLRGTIEHDTSILGVMPSR